MESNKRRTFIKSIGIAGIAGLAGCAGDDSSPTEDGGGDSNGTPPGSDNSEDTFTFGVPASVDNLDPISLSKAQTLEWTPLIYNSLTRLDVTDGGDFEIVPDLAETYEYTEGDGEQILQFTLRDGLEFHNGDSLDANVVKREADLWTDPDTNIPFGETVFGPVTQVSVDDDSTINFHFDTPSAPFLSYFTKYFKVANPNVREERGRDEFTNNPSGGGTGPYQFASRQEGSSITLNRNDNYHRDDIPAFETAVGVIIPEASTRVAQLQSGDIQYDVNLSIPQWEEVGTQDEIQTKRKPVPEFAETCLNHEVEPLGNKKVRQALSYAIDREALNNAAYEGQAIPMAIPHNPEAWWSYSDISESHMSHTAEDATRLLEEAGYGDGFEVEMLAPVSEPYATICSVLQSMWSEIGVTVNLRTQEYTALLSQVGEQNFEMATVSYSSNPDPDYFLFATSHPEGSWKPITNGWSNDEYTDLLNQGRTTTNQSDRQEIYNSAMEIFSEEAPELIYAAAPKLLANRTSIQNAVLPPTTLVREFMRDVQPAE